LLLRKLNKAAKMHSDYQQKTGRMGHEGSGDTATFGGRCKKAGYSGFCSAENVAISGGPEQVMNQWMNSAGHKTNILGAHSAIGVGKTGQYWTQVFGKGEGGYVPKCSEGVKTKKKKEKKEKKQKKEKKEKKKKKKPKKKKKEEESEDEDEDDSEDEE
jgi:hypothetical protein